MKTLLITTISYFPDSPGGSGRLSYELAHEFARQGNRVYMLVADVASVGREKQKDGEVTVIRYKNRTPKIIGFMKPWLHIRRAKRALRKYVPKDVQIIHGHDPMTYIGAMRYFKGHETRRVYTAHSPAISELNIVWRGSSKLGWLKCTLGLPLVKHFEKECLEDSDLITAVSSFTINELKKIYGARLLDNYRVIPGWVDIERFNPYLDKAEARKHLGWPTDKPLLFCLRRLVARMGIDNLLTATSIARMEGFDFCLMIGGEGELREAFEEQIKRLGLEGSVFLMGRVSEEDLPLAYTACDASIVPTRSLEGFGIIVLESLACGRPVLATPVGALPELLNYFEPEWIADSNDAEGIAKLISRYFRGELPEHDPVELHAKVALRYSLPEAYKEFAKALLS